jgi:hypothetical protein
MLAAYMLALRQGLAVCKQQLAEAHMCPTAHNPHKQEPGYRLALLCKQAQQVRRTGCSQLDSEELVGLAHRLGHNSCRIHNHTHYRNGFAHWR